MRTLALGLQPLPMPSWQNAVFPMLDSMFIKGTHLIPEPIYSTSTPEGHYPNKNQPFNSFNHWGFVKKRTSSTHFS